MNYRTMVKCLRYIGRRWMKLIGYILLFLGSLTLVAYIKLMSRRPEPQEKTFGAPATMKNSDIPKRPPHSSDTNGNVMDQVHIFYYPWYRNLEADKEWHHWNHQYLLNWDKNDKHIYPKGRHKPPDDIGSNFYPKLGCYSSTDETVIDEHFKWIKDAGIGVVVVSWYPPHMSDQEGVPSENLISVYLDKAEEHNLKIALLIEPYRGRSPESLRSYLKYINERYDGHPSFYKMLHKGKRLPVYYIYDSYHIPPNHWKRLLTRNGDLSVRNTDLDGVFLALLVGVQHRHEIRDSNFDGFFTYFASNGFSHGSTWVNWRSLATFAFKSALIFVPSVGPGYIDTQVRPWNKVSTRERSNGSYYAQAWRKAIEAPVKYISITSFNEWHEGSQIEPAVTKEIPGFKYLDYSPNSPEFYLEVTKHWVGQFRNFRRRLT